MARPHKEISESNFIKLCGLQCTKEEICGFLNVTDKTLDNWCKRVYKASFSDVYKTYSAPGKISLRRSQFKLAEKNAAMAIWLGKQYLGQRDMIEYEDKEAIERLDAILERIRNNAEQTAE